MDQLSLSLLHIFSDFISTEMRNLPAEDVAFVAAEYGFQYSQPLLPIGSEWRRVLDADVEQRLADDLSPDSLAWYEEDSQAILLFSCVTAGWLLGEVASGRIGNQEAHLLNAQIPGFILMNEEQISLEYRKAVEQLAL